MSSTPETTLVLREGGVGEPYAEVVLSGDRPVASVARLWLDPARAGLAPQVVQEVRDWAGQAGATVVELQAPADDPALGAVAEGTSLLGERMTKVLPTESPVPDGFTWRALTDDELGPWRERQVRLYAEDGLAGFGGDLELALADARQDFARLLPDGLATPDTSLVLLSADGDQVGHLWVRHHRSPGLSYVYDVEVYEGFQGRGHGRSAMLLAERLARRAGDDTLGLHVFGFNTVARRLYRSLGYTLRSATHDLLRPASA